MKRHVSHGMVACLLFLLCFCWAGSGWAGGFELGTQGARATGRAGAFVVRADDGSAVLHNPAGLAKQTGFQIYYSHRAVYQDTEFRRARTLDWSDATSGLPRLVDFEHVSNEEEIFPLGLMLVLAADFGLEDFGFAASVFAPSAAGLASYPEKGPQKYLLTNMDVTLLYYNLSAAWKYKDLFGIGATLTWAHMPSLTYELVVDGNLTSKLVNPQESSFDFLASFEGSDLFEFTATVGAWVRPVDNFEIALSGQVVPLDYTVDGNLSLKAQTLTLDEPPTITKDGTPNNKVQATMYFPVKGRLGFRYFSEGPDGEDLWDIELDLIYENWSKVKQMSFLADHQVEVMDQVIELNDIFLERRWKDTYAVRLGGDYAVFPEEFWIRAGLFYESPTVPDAYASVDFFSYHRVGTALGATYRVAGIDLSLSYTFVWQNIVVVTEDEGRVYQQVPGSPCQAPYTDPNTCEEHYLGQPSAVANAGTYRAYYHYLNLGASYTF